MKSKNTKFRIIFVFAAVIAALGLFVACGETEKPEDAQDPPTAITVSFDSNGGTAITLPAPTRVGYTFDGWFETLGSGTAVSSPYTPPGDITLHAAWTERQTPPAVTYTVEFESNGGTAAGAMTYSSDEGALALPAPVYYGYDFLGWFESENFSGAAVNAAAYVPTSNVKLYAKWDKVTYLYLYYGEDDFKDVRTSHHVGDVLDLSEITPPEPYVVDGITCPFIGWKYEDGTVPQSELTVGEEHIILLAVYDMTALPAKHHYTQNADGSITATGNLAWVQTTAKSVVGVYSTEVAFSKGANGGAGLAFRMQLSGNDYPYQDSGTDYLSAVIVPANGRLQVASVTDGAFAHLSGSVVAFDAMPEAWQQKYNDATGDIRVTLTLVDYGNKFEIYVDGELTYTFSDATALARYTGTGFGVRCSSTGSDFGKFSHRGELTISFEPNGGSTVEDIDWLYGTVSLPLSEKDGVVLEGWYYDEALTDKVNPNAFKATEDVTLYAKWTDDYIPVHIETFGGTEIADVNYTGGALDLPVPTKVNGYFTGWFYDEACTHAVDVNAPVIEEETTIYAGYRLPYGRVTDNGDGTYTTQGASTFTINALADTLCGEYEMRLSFPKGIGGAVGIAFRGTAFQDYAWEGTGEYLSAQIIPKTGALQVSIIQPSFAHLAGGPVALAKLPAAWRTKYNAAAAESMIDVVLKVEVYETYFKAYIDGDLAFTSSETNAQQIAALKGTGYGLRSSANAKPSTYSLSYTPIYAAELTVNGETTETVYLKAGQAIEKTVTDSAPVTDDNGAYLLRFAGWYTQETGGEKIEVGCKKADGKLYAHFERIDLHTVSYDGANGEATFATQYYEDGEALVLPDTTPVKDGAVVGGVNKGYTFDKWQIAGADIPTNYKVTGDVTVTAVYTESNAYVVSYVTNVDGLTEGDKLVAENTAAVLPELTRDGYRLVGWFTDEDLQTQYTNQPVTADITLYAKWIEQITVTFVCEDKTVSTQTIDKGSAAELPANQTKATYNNPNLNVHNYTFNGWYVGDSKVTATTTFDKDTTVTSKFDETVRRNGYLVTQDENGETYHLGDYTNGFANGITFPGIELKQGEFSFDLTLGQKSTTEYSVRIMILAQDENKVAFTGGDSKGTNMQGSVWVNFFTHSGQLAIGRKIGGTTGGLSGGAPALANIKDCAYKTNYNNWTSGSHTFRLKIVFGKNSLKYYIDDCLLIVYGDADYTGETLYGVRLATTTDALFKEWINYEGASAANVACKKDVPQGYKVGVHAWCNPNLVGGVSNISNIRVIEYPAITYNDGTSDIATEALAIGKNITRNIADSAIKTDASDAYLMRFAGWYTQADGGERVETAAQALTHATELGDVTLYAHYERVTLHTVTFNADNGKENVVQYYEDGEALVLPDTTPVKDGAVVGGVNKGYTFDKWQIAGADIPAGYKVTGDVTVVAVYTESNAYVVSYVTNADGITAEDRLVAENTAAVLPELTRDGYRLLGWYTDEQLNNKYTDAPITGDITLYAKWIEQITVTFVCEGNTVSTQTIDKGSAAELPANQTKATYNNPNLNVHTYTFNGWYVSDSKVTAATTFDKDTTVTAKFDEEVRRNGVLITQDENGGDVYTITGDRRVLQGFTIPDAEVKNGEFSFDMEFTKGDALAYHVRLMFFVQCLDTTGTKPSVIFDGGNGNKKQAAIHLDIQTTNGVLTLGCKQNGVGGNPSNHWSSNPVGPYKTKFDAVQAKTRTTLNFKAIFGIGFFKLYVEDTLIFVFGDVDYSGETLYGKVCTQSNMLSGGNYATFEGWMNDPQAFGLGICPYQDQSTCEPTVISNLVCRELPVIEFADNNTKTIATDRVTRTIADSAIKTDEQGDYISRFTGWYTQEEGGVKVETAADVEANASSDGKLVLYPHYERKSATDRNGVMLVYGDGGNVTDMIYSSTWSTATQGRIIPGVALQSGFIEYTLTTVKTDTKNRRDMRTLLFVDDAGQVNIDGTGEQSNVYINWNTANGGITLGSKQKGTSGVGNYVPTMGLESNYKKYFDAIPVGGFVTCTFRVEFGAGWIKAYVNGDLFIVYGNADTAGETNYGNKYGTGVTEKFDTYVAAPTGFGIGIQMWQTLDPLGGNVQFTDIKYGEVATRSAISDSE